eukprot:NODE_150_length_15491_cov_0.365644.p10 type:complete len:137 gc:universal NODE_150_length_15491_cov_0.365644:8439-8849(+)
MARNKKNRSRQLDELISLADKHMACISADMSKTLNDFKYVEASLRSAIRKTHKRNQKTEPMLRNVGEHYHRCYSVDAKAFKTLYSEMQVKQLDLHDQVKKQIKVLRKETVKSFPHLFNEIQVKQDLIRHMRLDSKK